MADPADADVQTPPGGDAPLRHLFAARLRARAVRGGLVKLTFGTLFLVGALAHALSPQRHEESSVLWITVLALMSTINVALGLRSLARARRWRGGSSVRSWIPVTVVWGLLAIVLLGLLLRR
ncbi:MAG: hypothetical protein ABUR63_10655 [Verrucomicrobiota bacterium]